jgi:CheY-like chemotaxis protein
MGERTILVADDDASVRQLAVDALVAEGFTVLEASSGSQAMQLFEARPDIDLIVTDIMMPGIDGCKVADMAKHLRPSIRIIYATGFAEHVRDLLGVAHGEILRKPYGIHQLQTAVQTALG